MPLDTSVWCIQCGYDLLGLSQSGVCPECGTPIADSTRGTMLTYSSPEFVKKLHEGVFAVQAAIVGTILLVIGSLALSLLAFTGGGLNTITQIVSIVFWVVALYGWWRLSEPDPHYTGEDAGDTVRKYVRVALVARVAMTLAAVPLSYLPAGSATATQGSFSMSQYVSFGVGFVNLLVTLGWFITSMLYIKWLGARMPSHRVVKRAKLLVWLGPLLSTVGIVLIGLGPLIALVLYWRLLDWVRKDLKRIRAEQAITATEA